MIFLISFTALAFEILLTRLFSIIQWHHFAYFAISLALLGSGASGAWLSLVEPWWLRRPIFWLSFNGLAFGVSTIVAFLLAQQLPFNSLEIWWDPRQCLWLGLVYLCLFFPFFFAANALILAMSIKYCAVN